MMIVSETGFGQDVSCSLHQQCNATLLSFTEALDYDWLQIGIEFVGIVLTGGSPRKLEQLTTLLWQAGIPHACVVLTDHQLQCGPLVMPGKTACHSCAAKRLLSLVETPRTAMLEQRLQQFHEQQPENALQGHTPALVLMAALRLRQYAELPENQWGRLTVISFNSNRTAISQVIPLHGCACRAETHVAQGTGTTWLVDHLKGALHS